MTKWVANSAWNALLAKINTSNKIWILSSFANDYNTANNYKLGEKAYSTLSQSFPQTGERVVTLSPVSDIEITKSGTATHVAFMNGNEIIFVTDITPQQVTQGGKANLSGVQVKGEDV